MLAVLVVCFCHLNKFLYVLRKVQYCGKLAHDHFLLQLAKYLSSYFIFSTLCFCTELSWPRLLSRPLSLTVSSNVSLYYSSPPLPSYLYQLLQSVCLSALLVLSVYTRRDISTWGSSLELPLNIWSCRASLKLPKHCRKQMHTFTSMHNG